MSRFKLKSGVGLRDVGTKVYEIAVKKVQYWISVNNNQQPAQSFNDIRDQAVRSFYNDFLDGYDPSDPQQGKSIDSPTFVVHFDGKVPDDPNYNIHIVIPDLTDKELRENLTNNPEFNLEGVATEAMGFIVITGCHS